MLHNVMVNWLTDWLSMLSCVTWMSYRDCVFAVAMMIFVPSGVRWADCSKARLWCHQFWLASLAACIVPKVWRYAEYYSVKLLLEFEVISPMLLTGTHSYVTWTCLSSIVCLLCTLIIYCTLYTIVLEHIGHWPDSATAECAPLCTIMVLISDNCRLRVSWLCCYPW